MIAELKGLVKVIAQVKRDMDRNVYIIDSIKKNEDDIIALNAQEQLYEQGINALGVKISDYAPYSPYTVQIKREKGQPVDRVTLRDTGEFHSSFHIIYERDGESFSIAARDPKSRELEERYGDDILGLTEPNFLEVRYYVYEDVLESLNKKIYGK